ncbi:GNAT family N-acetyltransferase, partial [Klebsiella pneumoniae]|uniref:GNAT family N-acetyltransferase n=1 Tax=Klebsiella pneumoniae TaxID=573 RepID=UPI001D0E23FF
EWVHVQLHQQKGMISLSPPTICNSARRTHAGRGVSSALIEACRHAARTQGCAKLRLDCHPNLRGLYERLGFTHVDTFNPGWDPTFIAERLELEI